MGAVQSDLKASIVQATSGGRVISPKDDEFWQIVWRITQLKVVAAR